MTITYRTIVLHMPPTPLGLIPERWKVEHWCNLCHQRTESEHLLSHAQAHEKEELVDAGRSFQSMDSSGTMAHGSLVPTNGAAPVAPDASTTTTDQRRR